MFRKNVVLASAVAMAAALALMAQIDAAGRGPFKAGRQGSATEARFGLNAPTDGPFPTDWFTVSDRANKTHRRVSLPLPDCDTYVSDCQDLAVLNELDGFNVQPRLSVPFSGPIDPTTVTSDTVFLVSLGIVGPGQDSMPWGTKVGIDQVVWDVASNILHVESSELLAQHTRFALIVTRRILDAGGLPIEASDAFRRFRATVREDYKRDLLDALQAARAAGEAERDIAVASVFTTQSVTAVLEKIRDQIHAAPPPDPADFSLGADGLRTVFDFDKVTNIDWNEQRTTFTDTSTFTKEPLALWLIRGNYNDFPGFPGTVGIVAFGKYESPDYLVHPEQYIPAVGTRTGAPIVQGKNEIYFNLFLPSGPRPVNGWPVAIVGHGVNGSKNGVMDVVGSMASYGIATIAINMTGNGYGPAGTLTVALLDASSVTLPAGGRSFDQDADPGHTIGPSEGANASGDHVVVYTADVFRQTVAELMQLVRVIGVGMDVDGDGQPDLDPSRVYYSGGSWGGALGTVFVAVEPDVRVAVLASPADAIPISLWGTYRRTVGTLLQFRQPSLLNPPGVKTIDGLTVSGPFFDNQLPLRGGVDLEIGLTNLTTSHIHSPVTNTIGGAMAIQEFGEHYEWAGQVGSATAYAPHLRRALLRGVSPKSVLFFIAKGDQSAPNPATTGIVRAGHLADRTLWYRHDLYYAYYIACGGSSPNRNPHRGGLDLPFFRPVTLAAQDTFGRFFASDGRQVTVTDPGQFIPACEVSLPQLFEFPIPLPLPEGLNYIR